MLGALALGLAAGRLAGGATGRELPWLCGWLGYAIAYLTIAWWRARRLDAAATRQRAQRIDPGAPVLFVLVAAAACASVVAVAMAVETSRDLHGMSRWLHLALAMAALAASWLLLQTVFAVHYAHQYYRVLDDGVTLGQGLAFPGDDAPDYRDFLYYAAVVGMTSQVSDVSVTSRDMRWLTLVHGLLSFAFNLIVLALAVNVFAGSLAS